MATARPLRDVFADVTGDEAARASDPADLLRTSGHEDLPDSLVAEAVTSYADTAPLEVAEHLSPYVMANSAVPGVPTEVDASSWLDTLAAAPIDAADPAEGLDPADLVPADDAAPWDGPAGDGGADAAFDLDFGHGGHPAGPAGPDAGAADTEPDTDASAYGEPERGPDAGLDDLVAPVDLTSVDEAALDDDDVDDDATLDGA